MWGKSSVVLHLGLLLRSRLCPRGPVTPSKMVKDSELSPFCKLVEQIEFTVGRLDKDNRLVAPCKRDVRGEVLGELKKDSNRATKRPQKKNNKPAAREDEEEEEDSEEEEGWESHPGSKKTRSSTGGDGSTQPTPRGRSMDVERGRPTKRKAPEASSGKKDASPGRRGRRASRRTLLSTRWARYS